MKDTLSFAALFILFTVIGTVTHELGHYVAGKSMGLNCAVSYSSCRCFSDDEQILFEQGKELLEQYNRWDLVPSEIMKEVRLLRDSTPRVNKLWMTIGGPLQTIVTGLIGLMALLYRNRNQRGRKDEFQKLDWLFVFLSLFWSREPFNLIISVTSKLFYGGDSYFGGDERNISLALNIWEGTMSVVLGLIGMAICLFVVFRLIPKRDVLSFLFGGVVGGIVGYICWFKILGPIILP